MTSIPYFKIILGSLAIILTTFYIIDVIKIYRSSAEEKRKSIVIKNIFELIIPIAIMYFLFTRIIGVCVIQSASMEPSLMTGDTVFINRLSYSVGQPIQRGDIVMFYSDELGVILGKRVIGIPGDEIQFKNGDVYIDDQYYDESAYISKDIRTISSKTFSVPDNCYFLLGDNREVSYDARYWKMAYISSDQIVGKYLGRIGFSFQFDIVNRLF